VVHGQRLNDAKRAPRSNHNARMRRLVRILVSPLEHHRCDGVELSDVMPGDAPGLAPVNRFRHIKTLQAREMMRAPPPEMAALVDRHNVCEIVGELVDDHVDDRVLVALQGRDLLEHLAFSGG